VCRSRRLLPVARILARLVALGLRRDTVLEGIGIARELVVGAKQPELWFDAVGMRMEAPMLTESRSGSRESRRR
jgi:hypothetical protein